MLKKKQDNVGKHTARQQSQLRTLNKCVKQENVIEVPFSLKPLSNKVLRE